MKRSSPRTSQGSEHRLSPEVAPSERITRYILSRRHYNSKGEVKAAAFMPPPDEKMSVYRTSTLEEAVIWAIGKRFVTDLHREKMPVRGRCDIGAEKILRNRLKILPAPDPHPRHADVVGWPSDKPAQRLIAANLVQNERFIRNATAES